MPKAITEEHIAEQVNNRGNEKKSAEDTSRRSKMQPPSMLSNANPLHRVLPIKDSYIHLLIY